jgi:hypothetical protein
MLDVTTRRAGRIALAAGRKTEEERLKRSRRNMGIPVTA